MEIWSKQLFLAGGKIEPMNQLFSTPGSFTFFVPRNAKKLTVTVIGGGGGNGGGAYINNVLFGGGGGAAGGKAVSVFEGAALSALKGQNIPVVVGSRGNNGGLNGSGAAGQTSSFNAGADSQVVGYGGGGGPATGGASSGGGGIGQTVTNGGNGGGGGILSSPAPAAGQTIEGVGTFGGGTQNGAVYIQVE